MSQPDSWPTAVTKTAPNLIATRGYPIQDLMGQISFPAAVWLMLRGELPDPATERLVDAILVSSLDHGTTSPSALTARLVASSGAEVQLAATAGLLAINRYHGGALGPCMALLQDVAGHAAGGDLAVTARKVVSEWRDRGERLPGFGHRMHPTDPRVDRLLAIAGELGFRSFYVDAARAIETALNDDPAKRIPMNLDGAIAAILCGLDFPVSLANPLFMISRFVGLIAQSSEEKTRMRPMRRIHPDRYRYDGPEVRHPAGGAAANGAPE